MNNISEQDYLSQIQSFRKDIYERFLRKGSIVYDIGAFKGVLTIAFAQMGFIVFSFEGSPINYAHLVDNAKDFRNITPIPFALHDHDQNDTLTRFNDCNGLEHPVQNINYRTLPSVIKELNLPNPSFIKMDIEGMETLVLNKCEKLIKDVRPVWQLSTHDTYEHGRMCVYENFPGFVPINRGGYCFNNFFKHDYRAFDMNMNEVFTIDGFSEFLLIPKERL